MMGDRFIYTGDEDSLNHYDPYDYDFNEAEDGSDIENEDVFNYSRRRRRTRSFEGGNNSLS